MSLREGGTTTKQSVTLSLSKSLSTINRQPSTINQNELHPPPHRLLRQNSTGRTPESNTYQFVFSVISVLEYQSFSKPNQYFPKRNDEIKQNLSFGNIPQMYQRTAKLWLYRILSIFQSIQRKFGKPLQF